MSQTSRTFRIFVSSTFSDLKAERNALQERVFPRLRELAMAHGCRFQAIDLRWGVSEEAALDQQTMKICLGEIERCQKTSPRPNFIILLGNRYGWRPLPYQIPADEYERIFQHVPPSERLLLVEWYRRDENAVPAAYVLQPRTGIHASYEVWAPLEGQLHALLETAARAVNLAEADLAKYTASATEQEILHGAIQVVNARAHIFCFARELQAIPPDGAARDFMDMLDDKPDPQAAGKLSDLKSRLKQVLGDNYHEYAATWQETGPSLGHLDRLCEDVQRQLERVLLQEIDTLEQVEPLEKEIAAHQAFGEARLRNFAGREEILKQVDGYLLARNRAPLVISGEAGSGKSALMAKAIQMAAEKHPEACLLARFIGATPASSDRRSLLQGLCQQITRWYGGDESTIPSSYNDLVTDFSRRLSLASQEQPLMLFLDALDQLSGTGDSRRLDWLPLSLPPEACLVVSSLPGGELAEWSGKIPASNQIALERMSSSVGERILESWLAQAGRRLQKEQKDLILEHFQKNGNPLYLKLVFEQARSWHSYAGVPELSPDIPGMISRLFQHLSRESNHGQVLVAHSLGYLAAARNGLSEDELIDLLSRDEEVKQDFLRRSPKSPLVEGLPVVLWSRLYFDLEAYLSERLADGAALLNFYHQQVKLAAQRDYLTGEAGLERHRSLADYFAQAPLQLETGGGENPNLRKLSEQVFQQVQAGMQAAACATLLDFNFLQDKIRWYERSTRKDQAGQIRPEYNGVHHLLEDFALTLQAPAGIPADTIQLLSSISTGLRKEAHILTRQAELAWQQLFNRLQWQGPAAEKFLAQAGEQCPPQTAWFRLRLPVEESRDLLFKLAGHRNPVEALAISPDGRLVASASQDMTVRVWLLEEGREKFVLQGHNDTVTDCDFHPGGNGLLSSSRDKTLKVWDVRDGRELVTLKGHNGRILRSRFSLDGSHILSLGDDNQLRIWETETGKHLYSFEGCSIRADWKLLPDGRALLACFNENQLRAIDLMSGESVSLFTSPASPITALALATKADWIALGDKSGGLDLYSFPKFASLVHLKGHSSALRCCAIDSTGSLVLSGDREGRLCLHDRRSGELRATLPAFNNPVTHCDFSPDGRMLLAVSGVPAHSDGNDFRIRFWETSQGQEVTSFVGHTNAVTACLFAARSNRLISAGYDQAVHIWQIPQEVQAVSRRPHQGVVPTCAFSPDGNHFVTVGKDQLILWDAKTAECLHQAPLTGEDGYWSSAFEPSGQELVLCGTSVGKFALAGRALTRLHKTFSSPLGMGECFAVSADASLYAIGTTGGLDMSRSETREIHTIYVSRVRNGETLAKFEGHTGEVNAIAFHPNGQSILSGSSDTTLKGWLVGGGGLFNKPRNIFTFKGHQEPVSACAFHPDEQRIISADAKGRLLLWEAGSQKVLQSWQGHASYVSGLAFSKDGRYLLSAGFDNWVRLWEIPGMRLIASLPTTGRPVCIAFSPEAYLGCVGEESGNVYFFRLNGPL